MTIAFGHNIKVNIYGESHGEKIGVTVDGLPQGHPVDMDELNRFLARRAPGRNPWSTPRKEGDRPVILSGLKDGITDGSRFEAVIYNTNRRPSDYGNVLTVPRPGHADYTSWIKYGKIETGGGKWSGRLTAPMCIAGGIIMQILASSGIHFGAHIYSIGDITDKPILDTQDNALLPLQEEFPVVSVDRGKEMIDTIAAVREKGDSIGGVVECAVTGLPAGIGDALYGGVESRLSSSLFAIPAVKSVEFGTIETYGSKNNDPFRIRGGKVETATNNHGGILGGITSGMPLIFRVGIKPTPSISMEQQSVDLLAMEETTLKVRGRHDPCIVPRAVPCVEAAAAIAIYDMIRGE